MYFFWFFYDIFFKLSLFFFLTFLFGCFSEIAGLLIVLFIVLWQIQRAIDAGYKVKRDEVEAAQAAQKKKDKMAKDQINANPVPHIFDQIRELLNGNEITKGQYAALTADDVDDESKAKFFEDLKSLSVATAASEVADEAADEAKTTEPKEVEVLEVEKDAEPKAE